MNKVNLEKIKESASLFRLALEQCHADLSISFSEFPSGSCGDTSELLGAFLNDNGLGKFDYVCAEFGNMSDNNWGTHAWLEQGDLVIDITADQFDFISEKIIVCNNSYWHKSLDETIRHLADYRVNAINLGSEYKKITKEINELRTK